MRTSFSVCLLLALAGAAPLAAAEPPAPDATALVEELGRIVGDPRADWGARWKAYKAAKEAIEGATKEEKERAEAAYLAVRDRVAEALRRREVALSGWVMGFVGAILLWGGFALHLRIAIRSERNRPPGPLDGDESWPLRPEDEARS